MEKTEVKEIIELVAKHLEFTKILLLTKLNVFTSEDEKLFQKKIFSRIKETDENHSLNLLHDEILCLLKFWRVEFILRVKNKQRFLLEGKVPKIEPKIDKVYKSVKDDPKETDTQKKVIKVVEKQLTKKTIDDILNEIEDELEDKDGLNLPIEKIYLLTKPELIKELLRLDKNIEFMAKQIGQYKSCMKEAEKDITYFKCKMEEGEKKSKEEGFYSKVLKIKKQKLENIVKMKSVRKLSKLKDVDSSNDEPSDDFIWLSEENIRLIKENRNAVTKIIELQKRVEELEHNVELKKNKCKKLEKMMQLKEEDKIKKGLIKKSAKQIKKDIKNDIVNIEKYNKSRVRSYSISNGETYSEIKFNGVSFTGKRPLTSQGGKGRVNSIKNRREKIDVLCTVYSKLKIQQEICKKIEEKNRVLKKKIEIVQSKKGYYKFFSENEKIKKNLHCCKMKKEDLQVRVEMWKKKYNNVVTKINGYKNKLDENRIKWSKKLSKFLSVGNVGLKKNGNVREEEEGDKKMLLRKCTKKTSTSELMLPKIVSENSIRPVATTNLFKFIFSLLTNLNFLNQNFNKIRKEYKKNRISLNSVTNTNTKKELLERDIELFKKKCFFLNEFKNEIRKLVKKIKNNCEIQHKRIIRISDEIYETDEQNEQNELPLLVETKEKNPISINITGYVDNVNNVSIGELKDNYLISKSIFPQQEDKKKLKSVIINSKTMKKNYVRSDLFVPTLKKKTSRKQMVREQEMVLGKNEITPITTPLKIQIIRKSAIKE